VRGSSHLVADYLYVKEEKSIQGQRGQGGGKFQENQGREENVFQKGWKIV